MKQVRKKVKKSNVETAATFLFENGITVIVSWLEDSLFEGDIIYMVLAVPDTSVDLLNNQTIFK